MRFEIEIPCCSFVVVWGIDRLAPERERGRREFAPFACAPLTPPVMRERERVRIDSIENPSFSFVVFFVGIVVMP